MIEKVYPSLLYLWDKRTVYIGPLFEHLSLSQGAATLVIALDKPMSFTTNEQTSPVECRSVLLPAGFSVKIDVQDAIIVNCNLDALGSDFAALSNIMEKQQGGVAYQLKNEADMISEFLAMYHLQQDPKLAYDHLNKILNIENLLDINNFSIDERVSDVIDLIKDTVDNNLSVEDLAKSVNLSVPRLVQVFKKQTGVPIRRYRLWHRLYVAAIKMGQGESLTDAAIIAGFTDSSHLSHTFRSMLGMKPSLILTQPNKLKFMIQ